jgi:hypothetical protein
MIMQSVFDEIVSCGSECEHAIPLRISAQGSGFGALTVFLWVKMHAEEIDRVHGCYEEKGTAAVDLAADAQVWFDIPSSVEKLDKMVDASKVRPTTPSTRCEFRVKGSGFRVRVSGQRVGFPGHHRHC